MLYHYTWSVDLSFDRIWVECVELLEPTRQWCLFVNLSFVCLSVRLSPKSIAAWDMGTVCRVDGPMVFVCLFVC